MNKGIALSAGQDCESVKKQFVEMVADQIGDPSIKSWIQKIRLYRGRRNTIAAVVCNNRA